MKHYRTSEGLRQLMRDLNDEKTKKARTPYYPAGWGDVALTLKIRDSIITNPVFRGVNVQARSIDPISYSTEWLVINPAVEGRVSITATRHVSGDPADNQYVTICLIYDPAKGWSELSNRGRVGYPAGWANSTPLVEVRIGRQPRYIEPDADAKE